MLEEAHVSLVLSSGTIDEPIEDKCSRCGCHRLGTKCKCDYKASLVQASSLGVQPCCTEGNFNLGTSSREIKGHISLCIVTVPKFFGIFDSQVTMAINMLTSHSPTTFVDDRQCLT
jgi:hypothetical protein